jgi:hypothetical protein
MDGAYFLPVVDYIVTMASGSPQGAKRLRSDDDSDACFTSLVEWVRGAGGMVHPAVTMVPSSRELQVVERIEYGTIVLQIPSKCLVTEGTIRSKNPFWMDSIVGESTNKDPLDHSTQDIELALFLAGQTDGGDFFWSAYLDSLPESSAFDALPRRWTSQQLELLTGSPLLRRIEKAREGVLKDYQAAKDLWKEKHADSDDVDFPSLQAFSDRMAAVSSRAFEGMKGFEEFGGKEGDTTMIPLLDLCNHHRGHNVRKNLSYRYEQEQGAIVVRAAEAVHAGDVLRITYGAQGNAQLLLNYGFCIPNNHEPDGSSNDVLEFFPSTLAADKDTVVSLRAGPKSYSYGGLTNALDHFCTSRESEGLENNDEEDGGPDDMEAFLDGCEDDEEEDEEVDWENDTGDDDDDEGEEGLKAEVEALEKFRAALEVAREAYTFKEVDLNQTLAAADWSPRYYAAILVKTEIRTILFFLRAIECIKKKLQKTKYSSATDSNTTKLEDDALIQSQVEELSDAYVQIRHSGMF